MHNRFHLLFFESMQKLDILPPDSPMQDPTLRTELRIVVDATGHLVRVAVRTTSGSAEYDGYAVRAVKQGAPFAPVPQELQSSNGRFYVDWAFVRDSASACNSLNALPMRLEPPGAMLRP